MVYLGKKEFLERIENFLKQRFEVETKLTQDAYGPYWFLTVLDKNADKAHGLGILKR
jgi:hypothetical protein